MPDQQRRLTEADLQNMEAGLAGKLWGTGFLCHPEDMRRLIAEVRLLRTEVEHLRLELKHAAVDKEDVLEAVGRLKAWLRDFGKDKEPVFVADVGTILGEVYRQREALRQSELKREELRAELRRLQTECGVGFMTCGVDVHGVDHSEPCALPRGHEGRHMWGRGD